MNESRLLGMTLCMDSDGRDFGFLPVPFAEDDVYARARKIIECDYVERIVFRHPRYGQIEVLMDEDLRIKGGREPVLATRRSGQSHPMVGTLICFAINDAGERSSLPASALYAELFESVAIAPSVDWVNQQSSNFGRLFSAKV